MNHHADAQSFKNATRSQPQSLPAAQSYFQISEINLRATHARSLRRFAPALIIISVLSLHGWSLLNYPAPFLDEAWLASRAWSFLQTGRAFGTLDAGVFDRFDGYWFFFPILSTIFQSTGLSFASLPSLPAVRVVSMVWGLILLAAMYSTGKALGGKKLGLLCALFTSLSLPFFYSAHLARDDIFAAAFGYIAVAVHLNNRPSRAWLSFLSGFCVGLAYEIHPHSAIFGPALLTLFFMEYRWSVLKQRPFWGFSAGLSSGLLLYAALHILPNPGTYFAILRLAYGPTHLPPLLSLDLSVLSEAFTDLAKMLTIVYQPLLFVLIASFIKLARDRTLRNRTLLGLSCVLLLSYTLYIRNKFLCYMILVTPALDLMMAAFLLDILQHPWRKSTQASLSRALLCGLWAGSVALNIAFLRTDAWSGYQETQARINQTVRPGDVVMGNQLYWFGLSDHVYYSWENLIYYERYAPGSTLEEGFEQFRPDIIIIDGHWSQYISDQDSDSLYLTHLRLSKSEMEAFLKHRADLVAAFETDKSEQFQIYRIDWKRDRTFTIPIHPLD